jgi:hypothetical protein
MREDEKPEVETPHFSLIEEAPKVIDTITQKDGTEKPSYHEQFFWKVNIIADESIDALLQDYE